MTVTYSVEKCPDKFDEYRCSLPEQYRKLAAEQLREDDLIRKQAIDQMRQWIAKHPYIRRCRTDSVFLLRFLRQRKFSIPKACEMLERYLALRQTFPHWFQKLDPFDKTMMALGDEDVFHVLGFDAKGQIVILIKSRNFRVDKYDLVDLIRFLHMNMEILSCDELVQVAGVVLVVDCYEASMAHFTLFRLSEMRNIGPYINHLLPIRCREIHVIRLPKVAASIVDLLFTYVSPKLKHRFFFHKTINEAVSYLGKTLLPTEYTEEHEEPKALTHVYSKRIRESREELQLLDQMEIDVAKFSSVWSQTGCAPGERSTMARAQTFFPCVGHSGTEELAVQLEEIAATELREDDKLREQALSAMREWIRQNGRLHRCRTDDRFLLRFLRVKKFSVPRACEMLERYLTMRQTYPRWFSRLDPEHPDLVAVLDACCMLPIGRDPTSGRIVIFGVVRNFDAHRYNSDTMIRLNMLVAEALLDEEANQIAGFTHIFDNGGMTMSHVTCWTLDNLAGYLRSVINCVPVRLKENHFVGVPTFAAQISKYCLSFASEKLRSRIHCHSTVEELRAKVSPELLPLEYGGKGPSIKALNERFREFLRLKRTTLIELDDMEIDLKDPREAAVHEDVGEVVADVCERCVITSKMPSDDDVLIPAPNLDKAPARYDNEIDELDAHCQQLARDFLRENPSLREQSLAQLRDWIVKHPSIKRCRTDARFLLRFLRTKKYSFINASTMLERYLACRVVHPHWFKRLDIEDQEMCDLVEAGFLYPVLEKDARGRTVIFGDAGTLDPKVYTVGHGSRMHMLVGETLYDDASVQCAGFVLVYDLSGITMGMLGLVTLNDIRDLATYLNNAVPMRIQELHFVNTPSLALKIANYTLALMNEKLRNRIMCHRSWEDLHKKVDKRLIPQEYGGVIPKDVHIAAFKKRCHIYRPQLLALDEMDYEVGRDLDSCKKSHVAEIETGTIGSFRKLQLD
uniref:CRAL-TRIO domain-containing protein n=1 Tax=Anopheles minimus TaxID=112268 RepID=A0A182WJG3_9DIPT